MYPPLQYHTKQCHCPKSPLDFAHSSLPPCLPLATTDLSTQIPCFKVKGFPRTKVGRLSIWPFNILSCLYSLSYNVTEHLSFVTIITVQYKETSRRMKIFHSRNLILVSYWYINYNNILILYSSKLQRILENVVQGD